MCIFSRKKICLMSGSAFICLFLLFVVAGCKETKEVHDIRNKDSVATLGNSSVENHQDETLEVKIVIDKSVESGVSGLSLGLTHTHTMWENGNADAVKRAKNLLKEVVPYQNHAIMGWGADNPQPEEDGPYQFHSLDKRVDLMRSLGGEMVLTLCTAPGWMKVSGQDWNMDDRVADEHVQDFADLAQKIAERYQDVKYFIVWNELKGYWSNEVRNSDGSTGNWDYVRYTGLYNEVYRAIKEVRPDAFVGGYYLPINGDGSSSLGYTGPNTHMPFGTRDLDSMQYWLENHDGADFIAVDRWLKDWNNANDISLDDSLKLSWVYGKIIDEIKDKTSLPIWFPEYYTLSDAPEGSQYIAAAMGSIYYHMIKSGAGRDIVSLLWNPAPGEQSVAHHLFTSTSGEDAAENGGKPTPHYLVYKGVIDHFSKGKVLVKAASDDPNIEVLATKDIAMLINKYNMKKEVSLYEENLYLDPYEVRFIDIRNN